MPITLDQKSISEMADAAAPEKVLKHPGMLSSYERSFLYALTCQSEGEPTIVDAGVFLGASTMAFCEALAARGLGGQHVDSFEYGIHNANTAKAAQRALNRPIEAGESFADDLKHLLSAHADKVSFHIGDINETAVGFDKPIHILFLDVVKDGRIGGTVINHILPMVVSGESVVVQQDYFHPQHPWLQFMMAKYASMFRYVGRPEPEKRINSAVFEVTDIDPDVLRGARDVYEVSRAEALETMEKAISFHKDPLEIFLVAGPRAAVQAWYDKDEAKTMDDFKAVLKNFGAEDQMEDPDNEFHLKRVGGAIRRFSASRAFNGVQ